jgi:hypothetical protein
MIVFTAVSLTKTGTQGLPPFWALPVGMRASRQGPVTAVSHQSAAGRNLSKGSGVSIVLPPVFKLREGWWLAYGVFGERPRAVGEHPVMKVCSFSGGLGT